MNNSGFMALLMAVILAAGMAAKGEEAGRPEKRELSKDQEINAPNHVPEDLMVVYQQIPSNSQEIDNLTIRLLHSQVNPRNATECLQAFHALTRTKYYQELPRLEKGHKIINLIYHFEDIYSSINPYLYIKICPEFKFSRDDHVMIYYLTNKAFQKSSMEERISYIPRISELVPLDSAVNPLIISSLFVHFDEKTCLDIIDQWKIRYKDNSAFIQEIEESKNQILYNRYHKQEDESNNNIEWIQ